MKKSWNFIEKILSGEKIIESRWYKNKYKPWGVINAGDVIYFKNSGDLISAKAEVKKVVQFAELTPVKIKKILDKYEKDIGIEKNNAAKFFKKFLGKKYCILIFLKNPKKVTPFRMSKKGFGAMASWIMADKIYEIQ